MCICSKIGRDKLYKRIYEPYERVILDKENTDIGETPYDEVAILLASIYLQNKEGEMKND